MPCFACLWPILPLALLIGCATSSGSQRETPPGTFEVIQVAEQVYVLRHDAHFNLFLVTDGGIVVADPLNEAAARRLVKELRRLAPDKKLAAIIYSHYHADHAGGAQVLLDAYGPDVPIIANRKTAEILAERNWPEVVAPTELIDPPFSRKFGSLTFELRSVGPNHSSDMLIGWIPEHKLVFVVDFISNESVGYRDLPGFWLPGMWESIDRVLELPIEHATFGHGRPGNKQSITAHRDYWVELREAVRKSIADGLTEDEAADQVKLESYSAWRNYNEWFPMNVRAVYRYERKAAPGTD